MAGKSGNGSVLAPRHFPRTGPLSERPWTCSDCTSRFPRPGVASLPRCRTSFSQVFTRLRQAPHFSVPANVPRSKTSARLWIRRQCGSRACLELTPHIFRRSRVFLLPPSPSSPPEWDNPARYDVGLWLSVHDEPGESNPVQDRRRQKKRRRQAWRVCRAVAGVLLASGRSAGEPSIRFRAAGVCALRHADVRPGLRRLAHCEKAPRGAAGLHDKALGRPHDGDLGPGGLGARRPTFPISVAVAGRRGRARRSGRG